MRQDFSGKTILVVQGSVLEGAELETAFRQSGAQLYLTGNAISAFNLLQRVQFDGAVVDQGLHNAAFDLCSELRDLDVPYICCTTPHRLQSPSVRQREAERAVWRLGDMIARRSEIGAGAAAGWAVADSKGAEPSHAYAGT